MVAYLPHRMSRLMNAWNMRLLRVLRPLGLTVQQFRVLQCVQQAGRIAIGEIARDVVVEQSTASRIVDQLQSGGLAKRSRSKVNPKVVEVALTRKGADLMEQAVPKAREVVTVITASLEEDEAAVLDSLLGKLFDDVANRES